MERIFKLYIIIGVFSILGIASCSDDDNFSSSPQYVLAFSSDTLRLDTVFSNVPTITRSFWAYNRSGEGIRCSKVVLENGNQTGFRVNVDGTYLGPTAGFQATDVEIRKGDSIRVFVELTSGIQNTQAPNKIEDNLIFSLESGVQQKVNLNACSWDAMMLRNTIIPAGKDSLLQSEKPIVVYGDIVVDSMATLRIGAGTSLYFHENAGLKVYGTLKVEGKSGTGVVLRGDRLDRMFGYLPYDRTPGRWQGIHIMASSYGNVIQNADIHSAYTGIMIDSSDVSREKLLLRNTTVHNSQGDGIYLDYAKVRMENCQLTNALGHCLYACGGDVEVNQCTIAQFYPFDAMRRSAIGMMAPMTRFDVKNSLVTGYSADEVMWTPIDGKEMNFLFDHCVLRTEKMQTEDSLKFANVVYEDLSDTVKFGKKHFLSIDEDNFSYDFRLSGNSAAIGIAEPSTALPLDKNGIRRKEDAPDAGCYQHE